MYIGACRHLPRASSGVRAGGARHGLHRCDRVRLGIALHAISALSVVAPVAPGAGFRSAAPERADLPFSFRLHVPTPTPITTRSRSPVTDALARTRCSSCVRVIDFLPFPARQNPRERRGLTQSRAFFRIFGQYRTYRFPGFLENLLPLLKTRFQYPIIPFGPLSQLSLCRFQNAPILLHLFGDLPMHAQSAPVKPAVTRHFATSSSGISFIGCSHFQFLQSIKVRFDTNSLSTVCCRPEARFDRWLPFSIVSKISVYASAWACTAARAFFSCCRNPRNVSASGLPPLPISCSSGIPGAVHPRVCFSTRLVQFRLNSRRLYPWMHGRADSSIVSRRRRARSHPPRAGARSGFDPSRSRSTAAPWRTGSCRSRRWRRRG